MNAMLKTSMELTVNHSARILKISSVCGVVATASSNSWDKEGWSNCLRLELEPFTFHGVKIRPDTIRAQIQRDLAVHQNSCALKYHGKLPSPCEIFRMRNTHSDPISSQGFVFDEYNCKRVIRSINIVVPTWPPQSSVTRGSWTIETPGHCW